MLNNSQESKIYLGGKLLYYSPASYGGIADYAHEQANALVESGVDVTFLCSPKYPSERGEKYRIVPTLYDIVPSKPIHNRLLKRAYFAYTVLKNYFILADFIKKNNFQSVLSDYSEYLAPLWSWRLKQLAKKGVVFGAVVHDPVRDFVVGPRWWHRWSIACGYSFLREAFVHDRIELDTAQLRTTIIPHGPYKFPSTKHTRESIRSELRLPQTAKVMLIFGGIRDGKNIDPIIRAMVALPDVYLVIAGKEQSAAQRPLTYYQALATQLGVMERCRWECRFIPDEEVSQLFIASDIILLIYNKSFRSASGVLNTAVSYRLPCVASAGDGALRSVVQKYALGVWIESVDAIVEGVRKIFDTPPKPQWERYLKENSWEINAELVIKLMTNLKNPIS